jgi:hypothetical protein
MLLLLHPVFFALGILGHFPFIITDIVWPRVRYAIVSLAVVKVLRAIVRPLSNKILVIHMIYFFFATP